MPRFIRNVAAAFLILAASATAERVDKASILADIQSHAAGFKSSKRNAGDVVLSVDISHAASCGYIVKDKRFIKVRITDWDRWATIDRVLTVEDLGTGHKGVQEVLPGFGAEIRGAARNLKVEVWVEQEARLSSLFSRASCGSKSFEFVSVKWDDAEVLFAEKSRDFPQMLSITLAPKPQPWQEPIPSEAMQDTLQAKEQVPQEDPCQKCTEVEEALCAATATAETALAMSNMKKDVCQSSGSACASCQHVECRGNQISCTDDVWKPFFRDFVTNVVAKHTSKLNELKAQKAKAEEEAAALTENKLKEDAETADAICKATSPKKDGCSKVSNNENSHFPTGYQCVKMAFKKSKFAHPTCSAPAWWNKIKTDGPFNLQCQEDSYSLCSPDVDGEDCKNGDDKLFTIQAYNDLGCFAKPAAEV